MTHPTTSEPASRKAADAAGQAVIVCVEKDPHVRDLETYFLSEAGFEVTFADTGEQALALAKALRPAIIITEIMVPGLDGLALCRRLKADPETRDVAVLIFSLLSAQLRADEAGADAFLSKPLAARRLVDTVRSLLSRGTAADSSTKPGV